MRKLSNLKMIVVSLYATCVTMYWVTFVPLLYQLLMIKPTITNSFLFGLSLFFGYLILFGFFNFILDKDCDVKNDDHL